MNCSTPGLPVHHQLPEFTQTRVHRDLPLATFIYKYILLTRAPVFSGPLSDWGGGHSAPFPQGTLQAPRSVPDHYSQWTYCVENFLGTKPCVEDFKCLCVSWAPSQPSEVDAIKPCLVEKEMATHSSIPAQRIPWTEEPDRLQSMGSQESDTN